MLAGSLTEFTLPDIFRLLASTTKTGLLHLTGPEVRGRVWILNGELVHAVADSRRAPLAARLLHGGEIGEDDVEPVVAAHADDDPTAVPAALTAAGLVGDRIAEVLQDQVVDAVFELSRWAEGEFAFAPSTALPASVDAARTVPVAEVLAAVDRRHREWDDVIAQLPSPATVLAPVGRPPVPPGGTVQLTGEQWELLTLVDGTRSVADLIALTGQGQFTVARLLADMVGAGLLVATDDAGQEPPSRQRARLIARVEHRLLGAAPPPPPLASILQREEPETTTTGRPNRSGGDDRPEPDAADAAVDLTADDDSTGEPDDDGDLLSRLIDGVKGA